jgi:hypothetical protein
VLWLWLICAVADLTLICCGCAAADLLQDVKVATALNWQMFCGCVAAANPEPGSFDPLRYNASFAREFAQVKQYAMPYVKEFKVRAVLLVRQRLRLPAVGSPN